MVKQIKQDNRTNSKLSSLLIWRSRWPKN